MASKKRQFVFQTYRVGPQRSELVHTEQFSGIRAAQTGTASRVKRGHARSTFELLSDGSSVVATF